MIEGKEDMGEEVGGGEKDDDKEKGRQGRRDGWRRR